MYPIKYMSLLCIYETYYSIYKRCFYRLLKEYRMVFRAGLRDPCTRDVARLSESVKILEPQASVIIIIIIIFTSFSTVSNQPNYY
jgi:hypothetical protein